MMKPFLVLSILFFITSGCIQKDDKQHKGNEKFTQELLELKEYFQIPGLAILVEQNGTTVYKDYLGVSDIDQQIKLDANSLFPIASITKVFSGVVIMRLIEQKKLSLDDPINKYLTKPILEDSVLVKHVLSHTSQGKIGKEFYYSSRFGLLTQVIEKATGNSFAKVMNKEIFNPLQLKNTFLLKDSTQIIQKNRSIVKPYMLDNGIKKGFIDFGYSTSAGIVSNLDDLLVFNKALDNNLLISEKSKNIMFTPFASNLPYGYGIFNQKFKNLDMVWGYGQYDCYSSLILKIPSKDISLILLANNSLLSDPARLIYGDITSSLFALSFLKNFVFKLDTIDLFEKEDSSLIMNTSSKEFYRKKLLAQALAESYMARFEPNKIQTSTKLLNKVFSLSPNYLEYANLSLLHNLVFLKDVTFYMDLGEFNEFDTQIVAIGKKLLNEEPQNPYVNSYMATYYVRKGNTEKAKYFFENIVNAKNFSKNWYTHEAEIWLKDHK